MIQQSLLGDMMGTMTAQILIGKSHPNDGGIRPEWMVQVSENSRPHVVLHNNVNYLARTVKRPAYYEWTPSLENGVEDIMCMLALHVVKHQPLINKAQSECPYLLGKRVEVYEVPDEVRNYAYDSIREVADWPKLVVSLLFKCYLERSFSVLEDMDIDFELCKAVRVRDRSGWSSIDSKREVGDMSNAL